MDSEERDLMGGLMRKHGIPAVLHAMASLCAEEAEEEERRQAQYLKALGSSPEEAEGEAGQWYESAAGKWRRERDILLEAAALFTGGRAPVRSPDEAA
jgi:hypothetical protein